jgi:hypothetical protein
LPKSLDFATQMLQADHSQFSLKHFRIHFRFDDGQEKKPLYFLGHHFKMLLGFLNPDAILRKADRKTSSQKRVGFRIAPLPDIQPGNSAASIIGKIVGAVRMASDDFLETAFYFTGWAN